MLFVELYIIGALGSGMWLLSELRKKNKERDEPSEDYALAGAAVLIASFWLPILLTMLLWAVAIFCYDALSSLWA